MTSKLNTPTQRRRQRARMVGRLLLLFDRYLIDDDDDTMNDDEWHNNTILHQYVNPVEEAIEGLCTNAAAVACYSKRVVSRQ